MTTTNEHQIPVFATPDAPGSIERVLEVMEGVEIIALGKNYDYIKVFGDSKLRTLKEHNKYIKKLDNTL